MEDNEQNEENNDLNNDNEIKEEEEEKENEKEDDTNLNTNKENTKDKNEEILRIESNSTYDVYFKVVVIGNPGVGKTCITKNAAKIVFDDEYCSTIGVEYISLFIRLNDKIIKLQVWDTCGQEVYRSLISNFFKNASLAIVVYSINNEDSFKEIDYWVKELKKMSSPDINIVLIGNKMDLNNERVIQYKDGEKLAKSYNFNLFYETSAKTGENIESLFIKVARILYENYLQFVERNNINLTTPIKASLNNSPLKKRRNKTCC